MATNEKRKMNTWEINIGGSDGGVESGVQHIRVKEGNAGWIIETWVFTGRYWAVRRIFRPFCISFPQGSKLGGGAYARSIGERIGCQTHQSRLAVGDSLVMNTFAPQRYPGWFEDDMGIKVLAHMEFYDLDGLRVLEEINKTV